MGLSFSFIKHMYSVSRQLFEVFVLGKNENHSEEIFLISTSPHSLLLVPSYSSLVTNTSMLILLLYFPSNTNYLKYRKNKKKLNYLQFRHSDLKYKPFPLAVCKKIKRRIPLHKICNQSLLKQNKTE